MLKAKLSTKPELILFFSVDLIGSTAFKNKRIKSDDIQPWLEAFKFFYEKFPSYFYNECGENKPELWKSLGDELLFTILLKSQHEIEESLISFKNAICLFNKEMSEKFTILSLKSTAWLGGFPIRNAKFEYYDKEILIFKDYIGPYIDIGFRISKLSTKRKMIISVDLASALLKKTPSDKIRLYYDGKESFKGVLNNFPYPIIWIDVYHQSDNIDKETNLIGIHKEACQIQELKSFCEKFIYSTDDLIEEAFIIDDKDNILNKTPDMYDEKIKKLENEIQEIPKDENTSQNIDNDDNDITPEIKQIKESE